VGSRCLMVGHRIFLISCTACIRFSFVAKSHFAMQLGNPPPRLVKSRILAHNQVFEGLSR
jgi:hypothetical protein